jgi:ADP-heptose:LPS heptosyltransferase/lauroyl/myristoyl acyltransferase
VLELILNTLAWIVAHLPEPLLRCLAAGLGDLVFFGSRRRRELVLSNLQHAFEDKPAAWHRAIGRESCRRLVETGLFSLAMPFISERRLRGMLRASAGLEAGLAAYREALSSTEAGAPYPLVFATAHLCGWESQTAIRLAVSAPFPEFGTIYRPLDNPAVDAWVKRSRERFGMRLLSRKEGFQEAMKLLRHNGGVSLLFDQNAGFQGALSTLFGRVCSTTELAGLLAEKFHARLYVIFPRRLAFWRVELDVARIVHDGTAAGMTIALNRWLESHLSSSDDACASWLWAHDRWRNQDIPARRLRLEAKRNLLGSDLQSRGLAALPRKTRLWIRLPNWLGDVVMVLPLLRALRTSRPDAQITLLAQAPFCPLLELSGLADRVRPLPPPGPRRFLHFWRLRHEYPDCFLLFPTSFRGDLEAWLTRCRQRFGLARPGSRRPLLTHTWPVPGHFDEESRHQIKLWEEYLRHFGLDAPPDLSPLAPALFGLQSPQSNRSIIGLICGSENNPEKRWPVDCWRTLVTQLAASCPAARFRLFGTANDRPVTSAVAHNLRAPVEDLAGRTDLTAFAARLTECGLLVTNDTGGMHLANALGVPVLALFGPTNPQRTGPVFQAPVRILQPPGGPPTRGGNLASLRPETVFAAVDEMLGTSN